MTDLSDYVRHNGYQHERQRADADALRRRIDFALAVLDVDAPPGHGASPETVANVRHLLADGPPS
jgi:hypothetical protein